MKYLRIFLVSTVICAFAIAQFIFEDNVLIVHFEFNITKFNTSILLTQKELLARRDVILENLGEPARQVILTFVERDGNVTVAKGS